MTPSPLKCVWYVIYGWSLNEEPFENLDDLVRSKRHAHRLRHSFLEAAGDGASAGVSKGRERSC